MSGALSVMDLVATLGVKIKSGDFVNAHHALGMLKQAAELLIKPFEFAVEQIQATAEAGQEIGKMSKEFGVAVDALQELQGAASLADVSTETLTTSMAYLARQAYDASRGGTEAMEAMAGIDLTDAEGSLRPVDELIGDLADKVKALPSATDRMGLSMKVMGRGSRDMALLLGRGRDGIEELKKEVRASGSMMSAAAIESSEAWEESTKKMRMSWIGLRNTFSSPEAIDALTEVNKALGEFATSKTMRDAIASLGKATTSVLQALAGLIRGVKVFLDLHPELGMNLLVTAIEALAIFALPALATAFAAVLPSMIGFAAGFAALYLIADDIRAFSEGSDSMIGLVKEFFETPVKETDGSITKVVKDLFAVINGTLRSDSWIFSFGPLLDPLFRQLQSIKELIDYIRNTGGVGSMVKPILNAVHQALPGPSDDMINAAITRVGIEERARNGQSTLNAPTTINISVPVGMDSKGVGDQVSKVMDDWWDTKVRDEFVSMNGGI